MEIEKGVPIPKDGRGHNQERYPFLDMEPGDSVLFEGKTTKDKEQARAFQVATKMGWKFVSRTLPEGLRIWRIK